MKFQNLFWTVLLCGFIATTAHSATIHWVGAGTDDNWSTGANWNPVTTDPTGDALHYDNGTPVDISKLSGTVDASYTVASMRLNNLSSRVDIVDPNGARHYAFQVPAGTTLTVSGAVSVGYDYPAWGAPASNRNRYPVTGEFAGGGKMIINGPLTVRNAGSGSPAQPATLNVSGLSEFTVDTSGNIHLGGRNNGRGVLILSPDNVLKAANIYAPGEPSWATGGLMSSLLLGEQNTLQADNIVVGGFGLYGEMLFQTGLDTPEVTIRNRAGTGRANLYIGDMRANDRNVAGTVDFTGGTVDAEFEQLQLGIAHMRATTEDRNISATGILNMSAGTMNANYVVLGRNVNGIDNPFGQGILNLHGGEFIAGSIVLGRDESPSGSNDRARGTINFSDGTLRAGTIEKGGGEAVFNFTGGTLHVGTFGSPDKPIDLDQLGGTLAPGNSIGTTTIYGNYNQAVDGILRIGIGGTGTAGTDFDFVEVFGNTLLEGWLEVSLLGGFTAEPGDTFDVLHTSGALDIAGDMSDRLMGDLPNPTFGWWEVATVLGAGGEGVTLRLSAVPEPSSVLLFGLGMVGVLMAGGRRSGKRAGRG